MAKPTVRVRIAFTSGPYVWSPTWTDVTTYVRNISTSRGRNDDWQNFDSGNATLVLDNRDRRFDPTYSAGPYYGNLQPRRQIRIDGSATQITNLIPNPSLETNTTNWTTAGATVSRSSTYSFVGTYSALVTATGTGSAELSSTPVTNIPAAAGTTYVLSAYARTDSGTRNMRISALWYNSSGIAIAGTVFGADVSVGTTFTKLSLTATAPANTAYIVMRVDTQRSGGAIGNTAYVDALQITTGSTEYDYFDGNTPYCGWNGTANNSTSYQNLYTDIFRGFIDGWPVNITDAGYDSTVTITCYEVNGLIAQNTSPYDWTDYYIRNTYTPIRYVKCDDLVITSAPATSTFTDYGSVGTAMTVSGSGVIANAETLAPGIPYQSLTMATNTSVVGTGALPTTSYAATTIAAWVGARTASGFTGSAANISFAGPNVNYVGTAGSATTYQMVYNYNATRARYEIAWIYITAAATRLINNYAPLTISTAQPHHFALVINSSVSGPTATMYVDGVAITGVTQEDLGPVTSQPTYTDSISGPIQQYLFLNQGLTATQVQTLYEIGLGQFRETTSARVIRAMNTTSLSSDWRSTTGSPAGTVAKINNGGEPVNTTIQYAGDSEGGEVYVSRAGVLTMTNRTWYQSGTSATSQATFGVGGIPIGTEIGYYWTAEGIRNALNVAWSGDTTINVTNAASIADYGTQQENYDTQLSTAADATTLGNLLVNFGRLPRLVMSAVEVGQALSTSQWNTVLGLELLDRVTVVVDLQVGSDLSQVQLVQRIDHEITPGDWKTTILGSSRWSSIFILNTSTLDGTDLLG